MLSKESKRVLFELYKQYLSRRKAGVSKSQAMSFSSSESIKNEYFPTMLLDDIDECIRELGRAGYTKNLYADGIVYLFQLTDFAIITLENQAKDTFLSVADFIAKFIP